MQHYFRTFKVCSAGYPVKRLPICAVLFIFLMVFALSGCMEQTLDVVTSVAAKEETAKLPGSAEEPEPEEITEAQRLEEILRLAREEREKLEKERKKKLGDFYVPLPPPERAKSPPVKARGIYLTGHTVGLESRYRNLLEMVRSSELNAMVIDVKNDHGMMSYRSEIPIVDEIGANKSVPVKDMKAVLDELHAGGIFPIARIVVFKDPLLAEQRQAWAIRSKNGGVWRDRKGVAWIDPYEKKVWDYNIAIAREAALLGFSEIQFDYVRFPENARQVEQETYHQAQNHLAKDEVIREFLIYAREQLKDYHVYLSADVFGVIATSWGDTDRIGQTWEEISSYVDYICPMVYPSHYGPGYFGLAVPDAHPATTVKNALEDSIKRNASLKNHAIIRPWLQNFTASWIKGNISYGSRQIREQIETAARLGIDEYLLWNANNNYQPEALLTAEEAEEKNREILNSRMERGEDALGRTPSQAVETYLDALQRRDWREAFALQDTDFSLDHRSYPAWKESWSLKPVTFQVEQVEEEQSENRGGVPSGVFRRLNVLLLAGNGQEFSFDGEKWEVKLQNGLWRVAPSAAFLESLCWKEETGSP